MLTIRYNLSKGCTFAKKLRYMSIIRKIEKILAYTIIAVVIAAAIICTAYSTVVVFII